MPEPTVHELKRALLDAGFEVYRTRGHEIHLAERPRENLIMDAGVSVATEPLRVTLVTRAQQGDFPGDDEGRLAERARGLGADLLARGYAERDLVARTLHDPGDPTKVLDTWHEAFFEKRVASVEEALDEVRAVFKREKTALP